MHWVIPMSRGGDGAYGGSQRAPWAITGLVVEADVQNVVYNAPSGRRLRIEGERALRRYGARSGGDGVKR